MESLGLVELLLLFPFADEVKTPENPPTVFDVRLPVPDDTVLFSP